MNYWIVQRPWLLNEKSLTSAQNQLITLNENISNTFLEKLIIFAKCFIADVFDRNFEYFQYSFMYWQNLKSCSSCV